MRTLLNQRFITLDIAAGSDEFPEEVLKRLADDEELYLFIDFLFLDRAWRPRQGKNPKEPLCGAWIQYHQADPRLRGKGGQRSGQSAMKGSDEVLRRYVAILALLKAGRCMNDACLGVLERLPGGYLAQKEIKSLCSSFHKCRNRDLNPTPQRFNPMPFANWFQMFDNWLNWDIIQNLFISRVPWKAYFDVCRSHVESVLDKASADRFMGRYPELAYRAVILIGRKIQRGELTV